MLCAISGHVPEEPVLSVKSGLIFERRLIEHEVQEHGLCPVTKEPLTLDDLIPIKTDKGAKPRTTAASSIPGLLGIFHDEWDALMLECHSLRQSLTSARQELSHALYQHDAACRVIARLIKERDSAREMLLQLQQSSKRTAPDSDTEMEEHPIKKLHMGITQEISDFISAASEELQEQRKEYTIPDTAATTEALQAYTLLTSQPLHATKQGGILAVQFNPSLPEIVASAGEDCTVQIFDHASQRIVASIEEHFKKVHDVEWIGELLLASCSSDKSVRVWMRESEESWEMKCGLNIKEHEEEVIAVTTSPNGGRFVISAGRDATLGFIDLEQGKCLERVSSAVVDVPYSCTQFHPDGRLLGAGTEAGDVHLWDMAQQKIVKSFTDDSSGTICGLSFHQNGHHMATATAEAVQLWDVRKMQSIKELKPGSIQSIAFDLDGRFLAIGGDAEVHIYDDHDDSAIMHFSEFPGRVHCVGFSPGATHVAAGASDHNLRIFG